MQSTTFNSPRQQTEALQKTLPWAEESEMMLYFTLVRTRKNSEYRDLLGADSPEEALEMLLNKRVVAEDEVAYADVKPFDLEEDYGN